jgi:uncharacterized protein YcnI
MKHLFMRGALGAAALALAGINASAHAVLSQTEARQNSSYRAVVQIIHGCEGAPTTSVKVTIPEGALGARPLTKAGWTIATTRGPYAHAYSAMHGSATEGVKEITWSGGSIPNDQFDEFVFTVHLAEDLEPGRILYFPVLQTCSKGATDWAESPAAGQDAHALTRPAPGLRILAATSEAGTIASAPVKAGALTIAQPWLRATLPGAKVAGGYLTVSNDGPEADRLISASIPGAGRGEVHEMKLDGEIMKMRPVEGGIEIASHQVVALKPGSLHLMFVDMTSALKEGDTVHGVLTFAKAGKVDVTFQVAGFGAQSPATDHIH